MCHDIHGTDSGIGKYMNDSKESTDWFLIPIPTDIICTMYAALEIRYIYM